MEKGLTFVRPNSGRFKLSRAVLEIMYQFIQNEHEKPEAGGILLGRSILDTNDIVIDQITTPMLGDFQSRFHFARSQRRHQCVIDQAWRTSNGTCTYLGEWHSHPEFVPSPSFVDRCDWQRKLLVDKFSSYLFFVIVGINEVRVWEGRRHCTQLSPLRLGD